MYLVERMALDQIGFPILFTLIGLPILFCILLCFVKNVSTARWVALIGALVELALSILLVVQFVPGISDVQFSEKEHWIPTIGVSYHLGVDGLSVLFLPLTAFLTVMIMLYSWNRVSLLPRLYLATLLALEAVIIGVFSSLDLILFFVFWELTLIPTYMLISIWGVGPQRRYAALKYVLYMLLGSAPLLIGFILLSGDPVLGQEAVRRSFNLLDLLQRSFPRELETKVFLLLFIGFAVKAPIFPFHTWLATVLTEGPIGIGVVMVGLKLGAYGFLRFVIPLLPEACHEWFWLMAALGVVGIIYGSLIALVQSNLKRLLAYSSVAHVGLVLLGLFSMTIQGVQGAVLQMLNMGIISTGLFFLAGFIHSRISSLELSSLGGLATRVPVLAGFFLLFGLAGLGLPGTNGFSSEHLILLGAFNRHWGWAVGALIGGVVGAGYFLWYYERAFFGPVTRKLVGRLADLRGRELVIMLTMAGMVFWVGFYPKPFLEISRGSVQAIMSQLERADPEKAAVSFEQRTGGEHGSE